MTFSRPLRFFVLFSVLLFLPGVLLAQVEDLKSDNPKRRANAAEKLGQQGDAAYIPALAELLDDPVADVRAEAVSAIVRIGTQHSLEPLITATRDSIPEIQAMAVDGLVNFYYPGYVKRGWTAAIKGFGRDLKNRFRDPDPVIIDPYVNVSPDVIDAIGRVVTGGTSMDSRANAARAVGILRGRRALPQLIEATRSKNTTLILEAVRAIEKIGETSVGPELTFLLRDLDKKVQLTVVEAMGQLRVREAIPQLAALAKTSGKKDIRRAALTSLAKLSDPEQRSLFLDYLKDKDAQLRAAAAEGLGRIGNEADLKTIRDAFASEGKESARLSMAFAAVKLGDLSFLTYLYDGLNSTFHRGEARPFLVELARKPEVLPRLYSPLTTGTNDQKKELAYVISVSGNEESMAHLEKLTRDPNSEVAQAAIRALKNLQARLQAG